MLLMSLHDTASNDEACQSQALTAFIRQPYVDATLDINFLQRGGIDAHSRRSVSGLDGINQRYLRWGDCRQSQQIFLRNDCCHLPNEHEFLPAGFFRPDISGANGGQRYRSALLSAFEDAVRLQFRTDT
jgi:hypothetical protein